MEHGEDSMPVMKIFANKKRHWQAKKAWMSQLRNTNSRLTCSGLSMSHFLSWSSLSCIGFSPWILASRESSNFRTAPSCTREIFFIKYF